MPPETPINVARPYKFLENYWIAQTEDEKVFGLFLFYRCFKRRYISYLLFVYLLILIWENQSLVPLVA